MDVRRSARIGERRQPPAVDRLRRACVEVLLGIVLLVLGAGAGAGAVENVAGSRCLRQAPEAAVVELGLSGRAL